MNLREEDAEEVAEQGVGEGVVEDAEGGDEEGAGEDAEWGVGDVTKEGAKEGAEQEAVENVEEGLEGGAEDESERLTANCEILLQRQKINEKPASIKCEFKKGKKHAIIAT